MKKYTDSSATISDLKKLVETFCQERNWQKHHSSKNLAMSISVEAAELMEHYQWEREGQPNPQEIADELSDIIFNCLNFAINNNIDVSAAFINKYKKLAKKYPITVFNEHNDSLEEYARARKAHPDSKNL